MFDFKVGQRVICKSQKHYEVGHVKQIYNINSSNYPLEVCFINNDSGLFTIDGRYLADAPVSLFPFRGTPESRRIVAMLANEWRKHKKERAKIDPCCDDLGDFQSAASLKHYFKKTYLKAKQLLNEE